MISPEINTALSAFRPVSLAEMDCLKLMNRMDTKFVLPAFQVPGFISSLSADYMILEIEGKRNFNYYTRYLDTGDMLFYFQHVTGRLARHKVRFRTYESTGVTFLEIKRKTNKNRTVKWRIENNSDPVKLDSPASGFIMKHILLMPDNLSPILENRFTRITLAGFDSRERITIDYSMSFSTGGGNNIELPYLAIAELKSEGYPSVSPFVLAAKKMGIRPTGFSKYCVGSALLLDLPKKNVLKRNILLLNKIKNEYSELNAVS
jgi:hypothetical protein